MKTLQELYNEIIENEDLKAAFAEAARNGKTLDFLKEKGCEATQEELAAFLKERNSGELSDEDLDNVAGGCDEDPMPWVALSLIGVGIGCVKVAIDAALGP